MRILFITAYFPPCDFGWGYMQLCARVADALHDRGHAVSVLTSSCLHGPEQARYPVHRRLALDPDWQSRLPAMLQFFFKRPARVQAAVRQFAEVTAAFMPEIIFIWHAQGLPRAMLRQAENRPGSTAVYYLANYYPETDDEYLEYWLHPARSFPAKVLKRVLRPLALANMKAQGDPIRLSFENTIHVSRHVKTRLAGGRRIGERAAVIPNGVDLEALGHLHRARGDGPLRLIAAGRISPEKGIHTLVAALAALSESERSQLSLSIMGAGPEDYVRGVREQVRQAGLERQVQFLPPAGLQAYRVTLAAHDVLVFPSIWDEPLSTTMLEAMALGLLVIGTDLGGSGEILRQGDTGLVFSPEAPDELARQLRFALLHPDERETIAARGERYVREVYPLQATFDRIERHLNLMRPVETGG